MGQERSTARWEPRELACRDLGSLRGGYRAWVSTDGGPTSHERVRWRVVGVHAAPVLAGLAWGVVSSLVNVAPVPFLQALSRVTGERWSWCVVAFCIGLAARRVLVGPVLGALGMLAAMLGYYGTDLVRGVYDRAGDVVMWDWFWGDLVSWSKLGVVAGAVFGMAGALTRRGGLAGALALLAVPASILYPSVLAGRPLVSFVERPSLLTWTALVAMAVSASLVARALVRLARHRGSSPAAQSIQ